MSNDQRIQHALELIHAAGQTLNGVHSTIALQLLNNSDQLCRHIDSLTDVSQQSKRDIALLMENLIRDPFRRQIGRLKGAQRSLAEATEKLKLNQGVANGGSSCDETST